MISSKEILSGYLNISVEDNGFNNNAFHPLDFVSAICWPSPIFPNSVVIFLFVISVFGITGNISLLLVVVRNSYLRSAPNILIINIMMADLLYIGSTVPFYIKHEFGRPCWLMGHVACKFRHYIPVIAQAACIFSITALSRERYSAIVQGLETRLSRNHRHTTLTMASSWVFGVVIASPVLYLTNTTIFDMNCLYMPVKSITAQTYMFVIFTSLYLFPLLFITFHHYKIVKTLCHSHVAALACNQSAILQIRARKRLAHIVLVITIFFALFWFPHYSYSIWFVTTKYSTAITKNNGLPKFLRQFNYYMALANSCLNSWIVFIMSSVHRNTLVRCFHWFTCSSHLGKAIRKRLSTNYRASSRYSTTIGTSLDTRF